ncbi:MAG: protein kinase [Chitinophagaceae bacterium]
MPGCFLTAARLWPPSSCSASRCARCSARSKSESCRCSRPSIWCREACDALHYAHERYDMTGQTVEVVHGQFSADSLLVDMEGKIKLIDFGCLGTRNATVTNVAVPARLQRRMSYMAPELRAQVQSGMVPNIDRTADIYSLGALLWELLSGETLPVPESDDPPPIPGTKRSIPLQITQVVLKAMSPRREERYSDRTGTTTGARTAKRRR